MADNENTMYMTAKPIGVEYNFYLDFEIGDVEPFYEFISVLREASPEDLVFLHINSPGGSLDTTVQVINAIKNTQATVVGSAEGDISSGAAYIFFSCHAFQIADHSQFLLHSARTGAMGKVNDLSSELVALSSRMGELMKDTLSPFFTKKEIKKLLNGTEHFLSSKEVESRIQTALEKMQEEEE